MRRVMIPLSIRWHLGRSIACARSITGSITIAGTITITRPVVIVPIVAIEIVVVVYVHVAAVPIAIAPVTAPIRAPGDSGSDCQPHSCVPARIIVRVIRISRWSVDNGWIVRRHVSDIGLGVMNDYHLFVAAAAALGRDIFGLDNLLLACL